jgi:hypothetical protein
MKKSFIRGACSNLLRCCPRSCPVGSGRDQRVRVLSSNHLILLTPRAGLEPATKRLTAANSSCSREELSAAVTLRRPSLPREVRAETPERPLPDIPLPFNAALTAAPPISSSCTAFSRQFRLPCREAAAEKPLDLASPYPQTTCASDRIFSPPRSIGPPCGLDCAFMREIGSQASLTIPKTLYVLWVYLWES